MLGQASEYFHQSCVVCESNALQPIRTLRDDGFFRRNNLLEQAKNFTLVRCASCGMVFVQNPLDPAHYHVSDPLDYSASNIQITARHHYLKAIIDWHAALLKKPQPRILEIGSGFGELYQLCAQSGYDFVAIEPSPFRVDYLAKAGLKAFLGTFDQYHSAYSGEPFDIVILDNVLEHIVFPAKTVQQVRSVMRKGSTLYLRLSELHGRAVLSNSAVERAPIRPRWALQLLHAVDSSTGVVTRRICFYPSVVCRKRSSVAYGRCSQPEAPCRKNAALLPVGPVFFRTVACRVIT